MEKNQINIGIGFATGRKSFQKVLRTYVYNWHESGLIENKQIHLNLFVAYDLTYFNTKSSDYTSLTSEISDLFDHIYFIDRNKMMQIRDELTTAAAIDRDASQILFGNGYSANRNAILYTALKNGMDGILFLDDDEYPMAVTNKHSAAIWGGQRVLSSHLEHFFNADITNGYHCGYVSPVPFIAFNNSLTERDFSLFIKAISNDVLNWDSMCEIMNNGGVTYADTKVLMEKQTVEVPETNRCKFITGSNLCINLTRPERVFPFYNPPGARGEDTFLSTCLGGRKVLRVPCYTFHDGFGTYSHLMDGVLPINLKYIQADTGAIVDRFYNACIGWMRYKPLYLYLTDPENYAGKIREIHEELALTLPKICTYFGNGDFMKLRDELEFYHGNVEEHAAQFAKAREAWSRIMQLYCN